VREWQVNLNAELLRSYDLHLKDIRAAVEGSLKNRGGGILVQGGKEYPVRILTAPADVASLNDIAVGTFAGRPVRLGDVASIIEGPSPVRGSASVDGKPGVVLRIAKQPEVETLAVTKRVDETIESLRSSLPQGVELKNDLFRQEWFINAGLGNVIEALRDGTIFVIIILILFLLNVRTTLITLTAIPLSILVSAIVFRSFDLSVNVMTLGGIAVAIGELVDDAIVGVENVFRRLREWRHGGMKEPPAHVVSRASQEVRNSIVYATALVAIVFLPVFFIPGVEGRLLSSLGAAYLVSLVASLFVSLTVTPVLCTMFLTRHASGASHDEETKFVKFLKRKIGPAVEWSIAHFRLVAGGVVLSIVVAAALYSFAGKEGIPPFNEGSATISQIMPVGTDLVTSNAYAAKVEQSLMKIDGVRRVSHITGRAGADPHDSGANTSEIYVVFEPGKEGEREQFFREIQEVLDGFPDADFSLGQPITHRVEELLSGVRAPIVVKLFGDDLTALRQSAEIVRGEIAKQQGVKNAQVQKEIIVPELRIYPDPNRLAEHGIAVGEVAEELEDGLLGAQIGQVQLGSARVDVVARFNVQSRGSTYALRDLTLPFEGVESIGSAGEVRLEGGRNRLSHEGGKRVLVVTANYQGSDIVGAVGAAKASVDARRLPPGVTASFEGAYKSQQENSQRLAILSVVSLLLIFGILYHGLKSIPIVLQMMVSIPTALIGALVAIWLSGGVINLAHLVGFISLAGIVSRTSLLLIGRCLQLIREEHEPFEPRTIVRATLDRTVPVLMTALVTALALIPLMLAGGEPGKELLHPLAIVIFGGLVSSTLISLFLTPALFYRFGKKAALEASGATGF
jgi:HME family heavy-metal exporter